jgi:PAS domain S-box-containing protein
VRRLVARAAHERHLASVVSSTCAATYAASLPDGPVSWTGDLRRLVGFDAADFAPDMLTWLSRIHPDDQRPMLEAVEQSLRTDAPYDMSYRVSCYDGAWRVWRDRGRLEVRPDGGVRYVGGISDATAESAAHARFAALNDRLRVAAASLGFGVYEQDFGRQRAYFSPEARVMLGLTIGQEFPGEVSGMPFPVLAEDAGIAQRAMQEALDPAGPGEMACECRVRRLDGEVRWVQVRTKYFFERRNEARVPTWATGVLFDVTERREREARLRGRDSRLRHAMRMSPIGIVFARLSGEILDCNDAFLRMLGHQADESEPAKLDWRTLTADGQAHDVLHEMATTGAVAPIETRLRRRDGSIASVFATGVRFDPSVDEQVTFVFDLTPMKQAEKLLRASERQFRLVLEHAPIPVFLHTLDGDIVARSRAVEELAGWTPEDTPTGEAWFRRALRLDGDALENSLSRSHETLRPGERMSEAVDVWTKDGRRLRWVFHGSGVFETGEGRRLLTTMALDVTTDHEASEALASVAADLRRTNALLDGIFSSAPVGIGFWDRELRFQRVNTRLAEINGLPVEAHLGRTPKELLPGLADIDEIMATWHRVIDEGRVHTVEVRGETPAVPGRALVCREHFFPVQIDGLVVGLGAVIEDITKQRETEVKLYDSERRFRLFADNIDDALWMVRPDDRVILYASPAYERIWGRSLAQLYENADEWIDGVHPDDRERVAAAFAAFGPDGGGYDVEFRVVRPDGTIRWVRDRGFPVRDESGLLVCAAGIAEDFTERRRAAERIETEEQRYQRIFEQTATSTWELDLAATRERLSTLRAREIGDLAAYLEDRPAMLTALLGSIRVRSVNPVTLQMLGARSPEELASRHGEVLTPATWAIVAQLMRRLADGRTDLAQETSVRALDGRTLHVLAKARLPALDEPADQVLLSLLDVTAMKDAEAVLREANQRKDEFLAMLAHELRNPLAPIRNAAEALRMVHKEEPVVRWARDLIERQVSHLAHIVDDLLDVSRIVQGKVALHRAPLDVRAVVRSAVETNRSAIDDSGHALVVAVSDEPLPVEGDFVRLAQVVGNLLTNAAKYTPEGGRISVWAGTDGGQVVIRVCDTGEGIGRELLPQVFDLFTQAHRTIDRSQGGLGIGLTVVKRLVEMHGGEVAAASEGAGRGSEFTVRLPRAVAPETVPGPKAPKEPAQRAGGPVRVLVVDDNDDAAHSLAELLRLSGYAVKTARDGMSALGVAAAFRPEVALLDLGLPGMDGFELARRLRAEPMTHAAMLVAVTGYGREEDVRAALAAGFDHHLVKPVNLCALHELLATAG